MTTLIVDDDMKNTFAERFGFSPDNIAAVRWNSDGTRKTHTPFVSAILRFLGWTTDSPPAYLTISVSAKCTTCNTTQVIDVTVPTDRTFTTHRMCRESIFHHDDIKIWSFPLHVEQSVVIYFVQWNAGYTVSGIEAEEARPSSRRDIDWVLERESSNSYCSPELELRMRRKEEQAQSLRQQVQNQSPQQTWAELISGPTPPTIIGQRFVSGIRCPTCNGEGRACVGWTNKVHAEDDGSPIFDTCPTCKGSGKTP